MSPLFVLILIGYAAVGRKLLSFEQTQGLAKLIVRIAMPMLIFHVIATRQISDVFQPAYFFGYTAASLAVFVLAWQVSRRRGVPPRLAVLNGFGSGTGNSGFIGYPLLLMVIGPSAGVYFAMNVLTENLLVFPLFFALQGLSSGEGERNIGRMAWQIGKNLLTNPMVLAIPAALIFAFGWLPLPAFMDKVSGMMAAATTPLALFMIGANLYGIRIQSHHLKGMLAIAAAKLLLCPLLVFGLMWLFGARGKVLFAGTLFGMMPMVSMYPLFGGLYGYGKETSGTMLLTTLLSVIPISLALLWWT
ncbi:AEC family transporter [Neisseria perflava]|uniref:AEC family transporter n=1 Tax=Neisseria perflava TaxID=33053 RepID=UPI0020A0EA06|nr:AEC family transporter [Neisseria perflava]MCP1660265.1 putative permease [Neisseria perflava]